MRIVGMKLTNFQGIRKFYFTPDGRSCSVYGDNGTGKTTLYNAYCWLLYGKPGTEEKSYTPQTAGTHGGEYIAEMTVDDGEDYATLKKVFREKEVKKRGGGVEYRRTTEHYIDDVPVKEKEYAAAVAKLAPESQAKLLTRCDWFLEQVPIKERREALVSMAGGISDDDVVAADEHLAEAVALLTKDGGGRRTVDEARKVYKAARKDAQAELAAVRARMDEAREQRPDVSDVDEGGTRAALEEHRKELAELQKQLGAAEGTAEADVRLEIADLKADKARLEAEYIHERNTIAAEQDEKARKLDRRADELIAEKIALLNKAQMLKNSADAMEKRRATLLDDYSALQRLYQETSEAAFDSNVCPICGQTLPPEMLEEKRKEFNVQKASRLEGIRKKMDETVAEGKRVSVEAIAAKIAEAEALEADAAKKHWESERLRKEAITIRADAYPAGGAAFDETEDGRTIIAAISHAEWRLSEAAKCAADATEGLEAKIKQKQDEIASAEAAIARAELAKKCDLRMAELRAKQKEASLVDEEAERSLWLLDRLERKRAELLDGKINGMFDTVKFRLSRTQANGEIVDDCEAMLPCDGQEELVPFRSANNARRVNAGLEVIDRLSKFYGLEVPIFIDNAESCAHIRQTRAQQVRLYVSEADKKLRMEVENG